MAGKKPSIPFRRRLMRLRKAKSMSLRTLANETGLSSAYLAQVEKGEVIPPVSVILQISRALEIDSSILLKEERRKADNESKQDFIKRTEDYAYENLVPDAQHKHLKAFRVFIDPKSDHKGVGYQHLGEEFIYVLSGKIEVMVGVNKNTLTRGGCIHFNSSITHKLRNISDKKAELLVVLYTP